MRKVADIVAEFLSRHVKHVFTVSGGADLHLIHAIWKRDDIKIVCPQNEQAAGFAADAYARLNGIGVALATSGPGAQNFCTPIATAYYDSVACLFITGNQTVARLGEGLGVRQYGFQATPICDIVKAITKYAVTVMHAEDVIPQLEAALIIAKSQRPGPVLIDLPDDVQRANI